MFYLTTHSIHFIYLSGTLAYVRRLYGVGHVLNDHSDSERGNPQPPLHGIVFPISSKGFIYTIPQTE